MSNLDLWLSENIGPFDQRLPMWLPWLALAILAVGLVFVTIFRRRSALDSAISAELTQSQSIEELKGKLYSADLDVAKLNTRIESLSQANIHLEAGLKEATDRAATAERDYATESTRADQQRLASEEKIELLTSLRSDMQKSFKDLADESLRKSGEELAKSSRERLEVTLGPLKEHVSNFQKELKENHETALRDREALKSQIQMLASRSEDVSKEAVALTRALKGDKQRQGAWGEMVLESILDRSGLRKGEEYTTQDSHRGDEGDRHRSDVIVKMPHGSVLVIDSKVSLVDYEICVNSEDEMVAASARKRHVGALRDHIDKISKKDYARLVGHSVDYTIMFIPIEGALSEALREEGLLTSQALEKSVMIATPTTLMMALRTIANFWTIDRRNRNAEEIARRAGFLYEKVVGFLESMEGLGKNLTQAQGSFSMAMDRLSRGNGNVLSQVDRLKILGARTTKTIASDFDQETEDASTTTALQFRDESGE